MNSTYFYVSVSMLALSAAICCVWNYIIHAKRLTKKPVINPMNVFSVLAFLAFMVVFIPTAHNINGNYIVALVSAFMDTIDSISFGNTLNDMNGRVFGEVEFFLRDTEFMHRLYVSMLSVLAPVLGVRAVFFVFRDVFTQMRFIFNIKNSFHIFSDLNEKSLVIAKDITLNDKNAKIIFCSAGNNSTKNIFIEQARTINALFTKKSVIGLRISDRFSSKKLYIYFIDEDEKNNVRLSLDKVKDIEKIKRDVVLLVFSSQESAEHVIDVANEKTDNSHIRIDLFNEAQRTAYNLVYEHPIYDVEKRNGKINIMILGAGKYGVEFAKAVSWCSQMLNTSFDIKLFDKQNKEEIMEFPFAELGAKLKNIGTELSADFVMCDVFSEKFNSLRFEKADYIFIDLGEDELNLTAALLMRKLYSRKSTGSAFSPSDEISPKIILHIRDTETKKIVEALNDSNIIPYGALDDVFTASNIYEWKIDKIAEFIHACYYCHNHHMFNTSANTDTLKMIEEGKLDYHKQTELNKRSSRATAVHCKYKFYDVGIAVDKEKLLSKENSERLDSSNDALLRVEHNRWNVFQMLDGWAPWDKNALIKNVHKNKKGKLHAYLAKFDELKPIAEFVYGEGVDPVEYDQVIINAMRFAYLYGEYGMLEEESIKNCLKIEEGENERIHS